MELDEIWKNFTNRMAEIELYHRATKDTAKEELQKINELAEHIKEHPDFEKYSASLHNMSFNEAKGGENKFYNFTERTIKDRRLDVVLHKNKQYQWLLAEAYEEFEDYLENMYAYYGRMNKSFWPLQDYGNITLSELEGKSYEWHATQARKKKNAPKSIINRFKTHFPELNVVETDNKLETNLLLAITLIEKLRHVIVHKGGSVDSKDDFIKLVAMESGVYNNGNISQENLNFINLFFGQKKYEKLITVLEIRIHPEIPFDIHVSLFGKLTNYLLAYAFLVYECVQARANNNQLNA